jgi:hypothetical protein
MAEQPAQEKISSKLSLEGLEEGSPLYKHRKKLIIEEAKRKKNSVVVDEWTEYAHSNHDKGGKCYLKKRMKNGNVHCLYLGRLKRGGKEAMEAYKLKGVERREKKILE